MAALLLLPIVFGQEMPSCLLTSGDGLEIAHEISYLCTLTCDLAYMYEHKTTLPPGYTCQVRTDEYGLFQTGSECQGTGLSMTYTSYEWNTDGECVNNATDVSIAQGDVMGNEDICDMTITITSDAEATECMYFNTLATRESNRKHEYWALIGLLFLNYL